MHVDEFIDTRYGTNQYARWVLNHFRLPGALQMDFDPFMKDHKLFCKYEGKIYRVTGASRMGDIWLAKDHDQDTGYDLRVDVEQVTDFSADPKTIPVD